MNHQSLFHTHIAFPDALLAMCQQFASDHPEWAMCRIGEAFFPNDPDLHEKHMVRGACHVLTIKTHRFADALTYAKTAFAALSSKDQIRLEIEQILNMNGQPFLYEEITLKEPPTFESHIVIQHQSGNSLSDAAIDKLALQLGIRYDMFDLIAKDTKATITTYFADPNTMETVTSANAALIKAHLNFEARLNTKLERVFFSGPLSMLHEWITKHALASA